MFNTSKLRMEHKFIAKKNYHFHFFTGDERLKLDVVPVRARHVSNNLTMSQARIVERSRPDLENQFNKTVLQLDEWIQQNCFTIS